MKKVKTILKNTKMVLRIILERDILFRLLSASCLLAFIYWLFEIKQSNFHSWHLYTIIFPFACLGEYLYFRTTADKQ